MVYGAAAGQGLLADDAPLNAEPDDGLVGDALAVEDLVANTADLPFTILRPAAVVGPEVDTAATRHFEAPRILVLRHIPIAWQFVHIDDIAEAVAHVLAKKLFGPIAVGAPGILDQETVEQISGMSRVEVHEAMARAHAERLYRDGEITIPPTDFTNISRRCAVQA